MRNKIEYNIEYLRIHYALIKSFLIKADKNILDISYSVINMQIIIQVVLLEGHTLSKETIKNIKQELPDFDILIEKLNLTKEQFNESKGEWLPKYYKWLDYLLFSKAEVL